MTYSSDYSYDWCVVALVTLVVTFPFNQSQLLPTCQTGEVRQALILEECRVADEVFEDGGELFVRDGG